MEKKIWMKYWRRATLIAGILRWVPYVRMIGLNGSMSTGGMDKYSDIDLYIVTKNGRIFTTKNMVTIVVHLTGLRRHGFNISGRICLNRYASEDYLIVGEKNVYHAENFHNLLPLYSARGCYEKWLKENSWMSEFGYPLLFHEVVLTDSLPSLMFRISLEVLMRPFAGILESTLRRRQLFRAIRDPRIRHPKSKVVITDHELRFHLYKGIR